ncbi:GNAT family N-acetyltransferase [Calycomorphotria hydatis]|nr:GNAT family N-acetyltransferase [Calycomorphotria hydatis]
MTDTIKVRKATPGDVSIVLDGVRALAEFEQLSHAVTATETDFQQALFEEPLAAEAWVAWSGETPAGIAITYRNFSTFRGKQGIHLEDLYVWPEFRAKRVAYQLIATIARHAEEIGACRLGWSVLDWNQRAIQFYEQLGAEHVGEWCSYNLPAVRVNELARAAANSPSA